MKKILSLVLVVVMCFALASCSFIEQLLPGNENGGNNGNENKPAEIRTTVTKEEWDAAVAEKNFTAEIMLSTLYSQGDMFNKNAQYSTVKQTETASFQQNKFVVQSHLAGPETTEEDPEYIVKKGDFFYEVSKEDGVWEGVLEENPENRIISLSVLFKTFSEDEAITFEDFTYNEENKSYEYEGTRSLLNNSNFESKPYFALSFEDGKIVRAEISEKSEKTDDDISYAIEISYVFTNFGKTVVDDIPEFTIVEKENNSGNQDAPNTPEDGNAGVGDNTPDDPRMITEEQFEALYSIYNYTEVGVQESKVYDVTTGEEIVGAAFSRSYVNKYTENTVYEDINGNICYYVYLNDDWFAVNIPASYVEGDVLTGVIAEDNPNLGLMYDAEFTYDDLVFDEEIGAYTVVIEGEGSTEDVYYYIYFENGNIVKIEGEVTIPSDDIVIEVCVTMHISDINTTVIEDIPEFVIE